MSLYLEQYLDSLETLPGELRKNLTLMRELDEKAQCTYLIKVDQLVAEYIQNGRSWSPDKRAAQLELIQNCFADAKAVAEEKVQLAGQTYELVDKQIRRLDADLARFEGELKQKLMGTTTEKKKKKETVKEGKKRQLALDDETPRTNSKKKKGKIGFPAEEFTSLPSDPTQLSQMSGPQLIKTLTGEGADALDMPVDPNEPTYCTCHQVSYGEMIGCDNPDCTVEWFHFGCVNLTTKPKGKWYCETCRPKTSKK